MPPPLSATEVAWMMLGVTQGVLALAWAAGAWRVPGQRAATLGWAAWAALSAATCALFLLALRAGPAAAAWLHAAGGTFAVLALLALQR
ncbi:MAG TPA: hypothetical protein VF291_03650, partial [Burkholderiaceae bacterium]